MNKKIFTSIAIVTLLSLGRAAAQLPVTAEKAPVILLSNTRFDIGYLRQTVNISVRTNTTYNITTSVPWLKVRRSNNGIVVTAESNFDAIARTGSVTVGSSDGSTQRSVTIVQDRDQSVNTLKGEGDFGIFGDKLYTTLRKDVKQSDIDTVKNLFVRHLAQKIFDNNYDLKYRLGTYKCLLSPYTLADEWKIGAYDMNQNVTGIMSTPGRLAVAAEGIPSNVIVYLYICNWTAPDGGYFTSRTYTLKNGLNLLNNSSTTNGLIYIRYFKSSREENYPDIKVHILNGVQNGVLSMDQTNEEMQATLEKAPYTTIDLIGSRMNAVFEPQALLKYTKGEYRRYINLLDTIVAWEQHLQGLDKYNRLTDNKTLAYVNYHYYMYRDGTGASFKYDTQDRVLSINHIMQTDQDVLWGISHEWGHQHQISPYFCWAGMTEVTNNMHSCYNTLHMGYGSTAREWLGHFRNQFLTKDIKAKQKSSDRSRAYQRRNNYSWNPKMYAVFESMKDSVIAQRDVNPDRAEAFCESYPEAALGFYSLYAYFSLNGKPDYFADLYESLRQTETDADKYAVLASAQNAIRSKWADYQKLYSASCWVTDNYIRSSSSKWDNSVPFMFNFVRKASRVAGYNLYPYFEQIGFMRLIATTSNDYGIKSTCMTKEMRDEFKADMDALVADGTLKAMPDGMIDSILSADNLQSYPRPVIPN